MNRTPPDLVVAGAGPSGLALAASALRLGARVTVVDPAPDRRWVPTWCAFERDLPAWVPRARSWRSARVELDGRSLTVDRPYVQVDGDGLKAELEGRAAGAERVVARALARAPDGLLTDRGLVPGRWVVDCTGGSGALHDGRPSAWQTAFGLEVRTDGHPWHPEEATWMDLRELARVPSFLYALPVDRERVFVEETALAARPAVGLAELEARLAARLERLGVRVREVLRTERCRIPLDVSPGPLAFGSAGGHVHPATGYLLARVLATSDDVAAGLLAGRGERALRAARGGVARELHALGLEVLLASEGPDLSSFFRMFFDAPPWARDAYLAVKPEPGATAVAMARLFAGAPNPVRRRMIAPLFGAPRLREVECPNP